MNWNSQLARCYLCVCVCVEVKWGGGGVQIQLSLKKVSSSFLHIKYGLNNTPPRPWLLEELNKVLALGKHVHDSSSSQAFLWNSGKNVRAIFGEKKEICSFFWFRFSLNCSQHLGYTPPPHHPHHPPSHLFSASPPATHFNLINDPSPTTRLCFYRLLFNVDLLWPVSLQHPTVLDLMIFFFLC